VCPESATISPFLGSKTQEGTPIRRSAALVPHNARFFGVFPFSLPFVTLENSLIYVEKVRHRFSGPGRNFGPVF
jgi:hypothetical protein